MVQKGKTITLGPFPKTGGSWNLHKKTIQPLFSSKYKCHEISNESVYYNRSYRVETLRAKDANDDTKDDEDANSMIPYEHREILAVV